MSDDLRNVQINIQKIPVGSGIGAGLLIAVLLLGMAFELPAVRTWAIAGLTIALIVGVSLILWRRHGLPDHSR
jgi:hypothetical protein